MMKKKNLWFIRFICLFLAIFLMMPFSVSATENTTLGDLRKEYENLLAEQKANQNKTAEAQQQIKEKEAAIEKAEQEISQAEYEKEQAEEKIAESNVKIEELTAEAKQVLLYMQQMQGQNAYVEYISGASSMTEMIMRIEAVKQVTGYIQETTNNLEQEIEENKKLKTELEEKTVKLNEQVVSYQATIAKYYSNIDEYDKFAQSIDAQVAIAKERYETNRNTCIQNLGKSDDSLLLSECSKVPVNSGWLKPLKSGVITSTVGYRWGSYHNALDLGVVEGTPVYAAAAGEVVATYYRQSCGGNEVFIYSIVNGVGYTHFYYHLLSYNVKVGDIVDQNTIIGYSGGGKQTMTYDRCTTGAHLHFGVAKGLYTRNTNTVITPPGFPNKEGYRWYSRTDYYQN